MPVVRTVVTSLPHVASTEKTYRIDPAPEAPAQASAGLPATGRPTTARSKVILGQTLLSVNLSQLLSDLEAESRRIIGPTAPPRG